MSINFDHSESNSVTIKTSQQGSGILKFPSGSFNSNILVSGNVNTSYLSGLNQCTSGLQGKFYYTNDINNNCSYSYANHSGSVAETCNSFIFGSNGVAKLNYCHGETGSQYNDDGTIHSQIVHSIPPFLSDGDAQNTTFLSKATVFDNASKCLIYGTLCCNTVVYGNFDIIGKSFSDTECYGVFKVKASLFRGTGNQISTGYFNSSTVVNCNLNQNLTLSVSGLNSAYWGLFINNASGIQWLTRASILEISATGAEAISTIATYWKCTANSGWFNLSNWFSDQYITTALSYPTSSTNVVMSGDCAAYVNMDCNLWVQPNSIDTTRVTDTDGVCLYSNAGKSFYKDIYGNVTMYGNAIFGNFIEGTYWRNEVSTNWFNLSNWFIENSFQETADRLPLSVSDVLIYGNSGVYIDMGCNLWVQPRSIDSRNSTADENLEVCIYSQNPCSFSGILYGGVTLYGNASFS
jgi:hypothetical protein